jgi:uncharacterized membrane protein YfcA
MRRSRSAASATPRGSMRRPTVEGGEAHGPRPGLRNPAPIPSGDAHRRAQSRGSGGSRGRAGTRTRFTGFAGCRLRSARKPDRTLSTQAFIEDRGSAYPWCPQACYCATTAIPDNMSFDLPYISLGGCVGFIVGLTGVGGGSLMTPALVLLFGIHPATAVGTDLLYAATTKGAGSFVHALRRNVAWRVVALLSVGSVPAAIATLVVLLRLGAKSGLTAKAITIVLGFALLLTSVLLIFRPWLLNLRRLRPTSDARRHILLTILFGAVIGVLVSVSSVGAGAIGVTALLLALTNGVCRYVDAGVPAYGINSGDRPGQLPSSSYPRAGPAIHFSCCSYGRWREACYLGLERPPPLGVEFCGRTINPVRLVGHRFQNPWDGIRNARLNREDAFSHAMIIVSSAMVSSS